MIEYTHNKINKIKGVVLMGTKSIIGISNKNHKNITFIMVSYDGYIHYVGRLLQKYYNNYEMAKRIVELGDLTSLAPNFENHAMSHNESLDLPFEQQGIISHLRDCVRWSDYPIICGEYDKPKYHKNIK